MGYLLQTGRIEIENVGEVYGELNKGIARRTTSKRNSYGF
ncbi:hypothetical protein CP8484711_1546, partial [Chlamydia psittaci 84-8471/1]